MKSYRIHHLLRVNGRPIRYEDIYRIEMNPITCERGLSSEAKTLDEIDMTKKVGTAIMYVTLTHFVLHEKFKKGIRTWR